MKNFQFRRTSFPLVISLIFLILIKTQITSAQDISISNEIVGYDTKGYTSVLIPASFNVNLQDEEVMAVGTVLDPSNPNSPHSSLHIIRYNNHGQVFVDKIINAQNSMERAVSICVYNSQTFVIVSSYRLPFSNPIKDGIKLTFIDYNGNLISEHSLELKLTASDYFNAYPLHAVMFKGDLIICGALQNLNVNPVSSSVVGLDFTAPKIGFVYNFTTNNLFSIKPNSTISSNQYYTLVKRLRIVDSKLYALGMFDIPTSNSSSTITNYAPFPFFEEINPLLIPMASSSDVKVLKDGAKGCATDIILNPSSNDLILLSQGIYSNVASPTTDLLDYTGIYLSNLQTVLLPNTFQQASLTKIDNHIATRMFYNATKNTVILAGWEQTNVGSLPSAIPYTRRNNAFLYELDLVTNTELNYSVFNNLNNESFSYRNLGGTNMSGFHLLPDNAIERDPSFDGYIINTMYKYNQSSGTNGYGLKSIYTDHISSCGSILNPNYVNLLSSIIFLGLNPLNNSTLQSINYFNLVDLTNRIELYPSEITDICNLGGKYRMSNNKNVDYTDNPIVFPNPTTGLVHIRDFHDGTIYAYNAIGQIILKQNSNNLDLTSFVNGIYFIRAFDSNQKLVCEGKVLKE